MGTSSSPNPSLPQASPEGSSSARMTTAEVYNLTVFVQHFSEGGTLARAANLPLDRAQAATVRDALSQLVSAAKQLIADHVSQDRPIPWTDPPSEATDGESRFMVPLHL